VKLVKNLFRVAHDPATEAPQLILSCKQ